MNTELLNKLEEAQKTMNWVGATEWNVNFTVEELETLIALLRGEWVKCSERMPDTPYKSSPSGFHSDLVLIHIKENKASTHGFHTAYLVVTGKQERLWYWSFGEPFDIVSISNTTHWKPINPPTE